VDDEKTFYPQRRLGLAFHLLLILAITLLGGWGLWQAAHSLIGPTFLLYLLPVLVGVPLLPMAAFRFYALLGAHYSLGRNGIRLRWGLRAEDIPMDRIISMGPVEEWGGSARAAPPRPWLYWPGSILGVRNLPGGKKIEYLASESKRLLLIETPGRIFAISPGDRDAFVHAFRHYTELGSLTPLPSRSVYPTFFIGDVWGDVGARYLILAGMGLSLALLAWVSIISPTRSQIVLGFVSGARAVPAVRLLLLPVINGIFFLIDLFVGLFLFRREEMTSPPPGISPLASGKTLAYLLWGAGSLTPLLFLAAVYFILQNSG
jgi:hypothetical protein